MIPPLSLRLGHRGAAVWWLDAARGDVRRVLEAGLARFQVLLIIPQPASPGKKKRQLPFPVLQAKKKTPPERKRLISLSRRLHRAGDFARTEAVGAHIDVLGRTVDDCLDPLDVGLPGTVGAAVRVGHLNAENNALVAEFTLSHSFEPPRWFISMGPSRLIAGEAHRWVKKVSGNIITDRGGNCKAYFAVFCKNPAPITASSPRSRGAWPAP